MTIIIIHKEKLHLGIIICTHEGSMSVISFFCAKIAKTRQQIIFHNTLLGSDASSVT